MNAPMKWRLQDPRAWTILNTNVSDLEKEIIKRANQTPRKAAVVFDLDGTLFDVSFRTFAILEEWVKNGAPESFPNEIFARLAALRMEDIGYSVEDSFQRMGFDTKNPEISKAHKIVNRAWKRKFFDGQSLVLHDKPHPGATAFVNELHKHDIAIVYLTGRSHHSSYEGTRLQLEKARFPTKDTLLILKQDESIDDQIFKASALSELCSSYSVVANFENEYVNIAAMCAVPENILHVIVDAPHSSRPIPEDPVVVRRIANFLKNA